MRRLPGPVGFEFSGVMAEQRAAVSDPAPSSLEVLEAVQRRVLWLATSMVHHANRVRTTSSGVKVGGHEASSASLVGIMTALYFEHLRAPDRVSVKPHAAPVLHAINYLLGHARPQLPDDAAPVRRAAELSEQGQGSGRRRLLDGLRRHRRDRHPLERDRPALRRGSLRRAPGRSPCGARRRRRARRGRNLGGARRSHGRAPGRGALDHRPQPAVARPGRAGHGGRPAARHVRGRRLGDDHGQVRPPSARAVPAGWRRRVARADRLHEQRGVPAAPAQPCRRAARAAAGRQRAGPRDRASRRRARRRRGHRGHLRSRRARSRRPARRVPACGRDPRPACGDLRVHDQGARAADPGASGQPLGPDVGRAVGAAGAPSWAPMSRTRGPPFPPAGPRPSSAGRQRSG